MTDFTKHLDDKIEDVERPLNVPQGTYNAIINKPAIFGKIASPNFNADTIMFPLQLISPNDAAEDVDMDDLAAYGDLKKAFISHKFLFNTDDDNEFARTKFQISQFLENTLGMSGKTINEGIADSQNEGLLVTIAWTPDKRDPSIMHANVKATAPSE